jgi:nucleoid-associated protein YgaU
MANAGNGILVKLTITPCKLDGEKIMDDPDGGDPFSVMINPSDYTHSHSIRYNLKETQGQSAAEPKFSAINAETVGFKIVLDGTGVVAGQYDSVKEQIKKLKEVAYGYEGEMHQPSYVKLLWGSFIFFGCLKSLTVQYTLFRPSGEPLRAVVDLSFSGFISMKEEALKANKSSPDLSHIVEVKAGDTLPLLCNRIYRDCSYYAEIAKVNNIVNFRSLEPGTRLHFPPLR